MTASKVDGFSSETTANLASSDTWQEVITIAADSSITLADVSDGYSATVLTTDYNAQVADVTFADSNTGYVITDNPNESGTNIAILNLDSDGEIVTLKDFDAGVTVNTADSSSGVYTINETSYVAADSALVIEVSDTVELKSGIITLNAESATAKAATGSADEGRTQIEATSGATAQ